jgi:uncharacterized protein (DUF849 family)
MCDHRLHPHAEHVAAPADHARADPAGVARGGGGRRSGAAPACPGSQDGRPSSDPEIFERFLPELAASTDAVLNLTTGGSAVMSLDERLAAARRFRTEMCSLNMGTLNFALYPMAAARADWRFEWEQPFLERTRDGIFRNTFADVERVLDELGGDRGSRFEFECYDAGHLYSLAHLRDRGLVRAPLFIQFVYGILGGIGPDPANLVHMKQVADSLFGHDYEFSVLAGGRHQMRFSAMSVAMGGNVRVGLEDSL